jgi:branched-chain amino acid transport system substrate-binding protein
VVGTHRLGVRPVLGLIAVAALFLGAGCSSSGGSSSGSGNSAPVQIGYYVGLTGALGESGKFESQGVKLAVSQMNAKGGILGGRKVDLLMENDNSDPAQAAVVARKFVSENVHLVLGGILDQEVFAVEPILGSSTLQMVTAAINAEITEKGLPYVFRVNASGAVDADTMIRYLAGAQSTFPCTKVFMVYEDDSYGTTDANYYINAWKKSGVPAIVGSAEFPYTTTNFGTILPKISSSSANCVFVNGVPTAIEAFFQGYHSENIKLPVYASVSDISQPMVSPSGPGIANTLSADVYLSSLTDPLNKAFVSAYTAKYGYAPERQAAIGYTAAEILMSAINKAHSTSPADVAKVLRSETWNTVMGPITFNSTGASDLKPFPIQVKNGEIVKVNS